MSIILNANKRIRVCLCLWMLMFFCGMADAQPSLKNYTVKNGNMSIVLSKEISEDSLNSFISKYDLYDLDLKNFMKTGSTDSLRKLGWKVETNDNEVCVLTKPLKSLDNNLNSPQNKLTLTERQLAEMFPVVSSRVKFGYNRFRSKWPFAVRDSSVTFFLRGNTNAKQVILSGSFNKWVTDKLRMTKTDSGWIATLHLSPGKYWYKFIIDGSWTVDKDNFLMENDGLGNDNSVFYKTNWKFTLNSFPDARKVYLSGSFNSWRPNELLMNKTSSGWELPIYLADGTHTYLFVVDGNWYEDPANKDHYPNEFGKFNSVIRLGKPYVFQLDGFADAKQVVLTGSFNGWRRDELYMKKTATGWELPYTLGPGNYEYFFIVDGKLEARAGNVDVKNGAKGNLYFVIEPNYTFRLKAFPKAKTVYLSGDFNGWSPNAFPMKRINDEWIFAANLPPGKHLYKFVVDGKWIIDPANKLWEQNEHGTGNSILWLGQ